jgi:perosamine synthetase
MKSLKTIPLAEPFFFGKEKKFLSDCIKSGWITTSGEYLNKFELEIKKITKAKYCCALINGSSSLQLAIRSLNPKLDDEILVPSITFIASVNAIKYNNCNPVFMDVDDSYLIDLNKTFQFIKENTYRKKGYTINKKTNKRIISVVIVHTFGNCVNITKSIIALFKNYNIKIIEDAAESLASYHQENNKIKHSGLLGDIGCLSFNGNKIITSGGGGMIITNNKTYYQKIKYLSLQAKNDAINFIHNEIGYNFRMSNIHAAIGLAQTYSLKDILNKRKEIYEFYKENLKLVPGVKLLGQSKGSIPNYWLNVIQIDKKKYGKSKNGLINYFLSKNIQVRSVWYPNHMQKPFLKNQSFLVKNSLKLFKESICLPSSHSLSKNQLRFIISTIKKYAKK